jgi:hypothetical protein
MAASTVPIFPATPSVQWGATALATANTAKDGTGTVLTVFTADATNGSRIDFLKVRAIGSNIATVLRVFINNGSTNATPGNNVLVHERTIAATTLSEVAELADNLIALNYALPAGYKVNLTIGTTVAAGLMCAGFGGHY